MRLDARLEPGAVRDLLLRNEALEQQLSECTQALERATLERQQAQQQLKHLSLHDSLTGLVNRRHFFVLAMAEVARALRHGRPLALLRVDVDGFRRINDEHGHAVGDKALKKLAEHLLAATRPQDVSARLGAQEFVMLLPQTTQADALALAQALGRRVAVHGVSGIPMTVSIGVAQLLADEDCIEAALIRAENALRQAKALGPNQVVPGVGGGKLVR